MTIEWYRIEAPHFCAAVKVEDAQVVDTAPILRWILMRRNRSLAWLLGYCSTQRWLVDKLS